MVVEQRFPPSPTVVEQRFPHGYSVTKQGLPHRFMAAEQELPHQESTVKYGLHLSRVSGSMDEDIQCLERSDGLAPCCNSPASSTDPKHDEKTNIENLALECVHAIVYVTKNPQRPQYIDFTSSLRVTRRLLQAFQEPPGSNSCVTLRKALWIRCS